MAVPIEDVDHFLAMVGTRFDVERFEIGRAKKLSINDQGANGLVVAVVTEFVEDDVVWDGVGVLIVEKGSNSRMTVIITGLGLGCANATEFKLRIERLIGAGTKQYFRLASQMLLKQEAEANGRAAAK